MTHYEIDFKKRLSSLILSHTVEVNQDHADCRVKVIVVESCQQNIIKVNCSHCIYCYLYFRDTLLVSLSSECGFEGLKCYQASAHSCVLPR